MSTTKLIGAYTAPGVNYPPFFNASVDGDEVVVTVRAPGTVREGVYVCANPRDAGQPGRCSPGDAFCNNYCNMAPQKGPMQDSPLRCTNHIEGACAQMRMPLAEFQAICREGVGL